MIKWKKIWLKTTKIHSCGILILFLISILFACTGESTNQSPSSNSKNSFSSVSNNSVSSLSASSAANYIGSNKTVCGQIVDSKFARSSNGSPTFLNFDLPYPRHPFTVVIWGNQKANFPANPERYYLNKYVCATGLIETYNGKPQIVAENQTQLRINN